MLRLSSIFCVKKILTILVGLLCGGKLWPWVFQVVQKPISANGKDMFVLFIWEFFPCVFGCKLRMQLSQVTNGFP
jgi:hypothetical protein